MSVPFGIQKGVSKNQIKVGKETSLFNYQILEVPRPHSYFPYVYAQITPINGVSRITAKGDLINAGRYGINLKNIYDELLEQLSNKYGKPGNKMNNLDNVMKSHNFIDLYRNPRLYFYAAWGAKKGLSLQNDLKFIQLEFYAADSSNGFFMLNYDYDNYRLAVEEIKNINDTAL